MSITFGRITNAVTADSNLWRFTTPPGPDNIELNNAAGVQGIIAPMPGNSTYVLLLTDGFGSPIAAHIISDGDLFALAGVTESGGVKSAVLRMVDNTTGDDARVNVFDNFSIQIIAEDAASQSGKILTKTQNDDQVADVAANDFTRELRRFDSHVTELRTAGSLVADIRLEVLRSFISRITPNGSMNVNLTQDGAGAGNDLAQLQLFDTVLDNDVHVAVVKEYAFLQYADDPTGANDRMQVKARIDRAAVEFNDVEVFAVKSDGKIQTNQVAAPGVHAVLAGEIEIFDNAGASLGFIPVFT